MARPPLPDVVSARELATAAGVPLEVVRGLIVGGTVRTIDGRYIAWNEARRALTALSRDPSWTAAYRTPEGEQVLFGRPASPPRHAGVPLAVSSTLHVAVLAGAVLFTTVGLTSHEPLMPVFETVPARLVYLNLPGPGGGGGGGGLRQTAPPPQAQRQGESHVSSPLPPRQPPAIPANEPPAPEPPPLAYESLPPVTAPVITAPADRRDRAGILDETIADTESRGPGAGGGTGDGRGVGIGGGEGAGIGDGSGGGTGGGPYGPGSGVEPPRLLHEVKPAYPDAARRQGIEGDVVLEIVVRANGSVGDIRVLRRLGAGLDERAIEAVRQWRFAPARRFGEPVDVVVEVAVEFKLR